MTSRLRLAFTLLALAGLFIAIAGPALDHHFAARQPAHGHVFMARVPLEHDHALDAAHAHESGEHTRAGILFTIDRDASGTAVNAVAPPAPPPTSDGAGPARFVAISGDDEPPAGLIPQPLDRPPTA